jgi:F-type H+-transporting ATPase subunit epsilon
MDLTIQNEERTLFEGDAEFIAVPTPEGEIGILAGHARMIAPLHPGTLRVRKKQTKRDFDIHGGFIEIVEDRVRVYTPSVERRE